MASLFLPFLSPPPISLMFFLPHEFMISSLITIFTFMSKYKHIICVHLIYLAHFVLLMCTCVHG